MLIRFLSQRLREGEPRRDGDGSRLPTGRYQKGATIITSNKSLANWGELIGDTALMMAIIDRLLHQGEVFYLRGSSYRLLGKEQVSLMAKPDLSVVPSNGKASV